MSREQCCCILSNSFFCTFEKISNPSTWMTDQLSSINFDELFDIAQNSQIKLAKIRMIINYFNRVSVQSLISFKKFLNF